MGLVRAAKWAWEDALSRTAPHRKGGGKGKGREGMGVIALSRWGDERQGGRFMFAIKGVVAFKPHIFCYEPYCQREEGENEAGRGRRR